MVIANKRRAAYALVFAAGISATSLGIASIADLDLTGVTRPAPSTMGALEVAVAATQPADPVPVVPTLPAPPASPAPSPALPTPPASPAPGVALPSTPIGLVLSVVRSR